MERVASFGQDHWRNVAQFRTASLIYGAIDGGGSWEHHAHRKPPTIKPGVSFYGRAVELSDTGYQ